MRTILLLFLSSCLVVAAPVPKSRRKPAVSLEGVWHLVERNGQKVRPKSLYWCMSETGQLDDGFFPGDKPEYTFFYAVDQETSPLQMDYWDIDSPREDAVKCIVEITGDELTICLSRGKRPTEFVRIQGKQHLWVFKRWGTEK